MMRRFFESRLAFAATALAFAMAAGVNASISAPATTVPSLDPVLLSHDDPNMPPPPWCDTCNSPDTKKPDGLLLASERPKMMDDPNMPPPPWCDT